MRTAIAAPTIGSMQIASKNKGKGRRARRAGLDVAQTLAVAAQMALLCPSGIDVWMQRELTGCTDLDRPDPRRRG